MSYSRAMRELADPRTVRLTVFQCSNLIRSLKFAASIGETEAGEAVDPGARELLLEYVRVIGVSLESLEEALRMAKDETVDAQAADSPAVPEVVPEAVPDPGELPTERKHWH